MELKCQQLHATAAKWLKRDSQQIHLNDKSSGGSNILEHLINCKTEKEIWDKIRGASQTVHQLQLRHYSLKVSEAADMQKHL
jgi:hypothetical protein